MVEYNADVSLRISDGALFGRWSLGRILPAGCRMQVFVVERGTYPRSSRNNDLAIRHAGGGFEQAREVSLEFLFSAARQEGENGLAAQTVGAQELFARHSVLSIIFHRIQTRIADVSNLVSIGLIERNLEGKDGKDFVDVAPNVVDTPRFPSPDFRGDIVLDGNLCVAVDIVGDFQVEPRVVDEDDNVGIPVNNIFPAEVHVAQDGASM